MAAKKTCSFYRELNNLSTADFFNDQKRLKSSAKGPYYEVERVISKRNRKGKVSCFVLFVRSDVLKWSQSIIRLKYISITP